MKRAILLGVVLLVAAAAARAELGVYAEITYPSSTTWRLWATQCDWQGSTAGLTPAGGGIRGLCINVSGVTTAYKAMPSYATICDSEYQAYTIGFSNGPLVMSVSNGTAQLYAEQEMLDPIEVIHGFGVTAGSYVPPPGWSWYESTGYAWDAPGAPGSSSPGVLVFAGKRPVDGQVTIDFAASPLQHVFTSNADNVGIAVPLVPEPSSLALLLLTGLAVRRRK